MLAVSILHLSLSPGLNPLVSPQGSVCPCLPHPHHLPLSLPTFSESPTSDVFLQGCLQELRGERKKVEKRREGGREEEKADEGEEIREQRQLGERKEEWDRRARGGRRRKEGRRKRREGKDKLERRKKHKERRRDQKEVEQV